MTIPLGAVLSRPYKGSFILRGDFWIINFGNRYYGWLKVTLQLLRKIVPKPALLDRSRLAGLQDLIFRKIEISIKNQPVTNKCTFFATPNFFKHLANFSLDAKDACKCELVTLGLRSNSLKTLASPLWFQNAGDCRKCQSLFGAPPYRVALKPAGCSPLFGWRF